MEKEEAQELLRRYHAGLCTERELAIINRWYQSFDEIDLDLVDETTLNATKDQMLEKITERIAEIEGRKQLNRLHRRPSRQRHLFNLSDLKKIAAILILVISVAFFFYNRNKQAFPEHNTLSETHQPKKVMPSVIYLSDGSRVRLKEDSKLEYPTVFRGDTREVTLIGEAFFEVAKNKEKPFIIHAAGLTTKVLGTSFNIKAYENDASAEVTVVTGKVSVSVNNETKLENKDIVLMRNQKAIYSKNGDLIMREVTDKGILNKIDKKTNLVFNETPLKEIIKVLNTYYEANIILANEALKNCLITAELTDEPIEMSLKILTKAIGAEYEVNEDEIILKGKGCPNTE